MSRKRYFIRPLEHGMSSEAPALNLPHQISPSVVNCRIDQRSIQNREGYHTQDRDIGEGLKVYGIDIFQVASGSRYTLYLTAADLILKETGASDTWSYKTELQDLNGSIASISGATVTFKASTVADTVDIATGDYFILEDDITADREPQSAWSYINSAADAGGFYTTLTLSASYSGTTGSWGGSDKDCRIRNVYTTPEDERWTWAIVDDKFCFTNGNTDVQYWAGSNFAASLDSTNAVKARYCIEYANRLILADEGSTRDPYIIKWSKEGDPTDWTDTTAGSNALLATSDYITGLGRVGSDLVVYKRDSIVFAHETGIATSPIAFPTHRRGVGCIAPYSIVHVRGTNVFLGRDDFYQIEGQYPRPIGGSNESRMKHRFFDIVNDTDALYTWGEANLNTNVVHWFANTSEGHRCFTWNYITGEWTEDEFYHEISALGRGAI
jgi:hypothetical protein